MHEFSRGATLTIDASLSLSRDQIVLEDGDISALVSVEAILLRLGEGSVSTGTQRQRQLIIILKRLINLAQLHVSDGRILGRQPRSLHISGFLRVNLLVHLTSEARYALDTLRLERSGLAETTLRVLCVLEFVVCLTGSVVGLVAVSDGISSVSMKVIVA